MRILDLFCGAGGAAMGYHQAFPDAEITGVDINPQPRYLFRFVRYDATNIAEFFAFYDLVHASPPCQAHTTMSNRHRGKGGKADSHVDLIALIRHQLVKSGVPYVIENVPGARKMMRHPVTLQGGMFGLGVERPRLFECSFPVTPAAVPQVRQPDRCVRAASRRPPAVDPQGRVNATGGRVACRGACGDGDRLDGVAGARRVHPTRIHRVHRARLQGDAARSGRRVTAPHWCGCRSCEAARRYLQIEPPEPPANDTDTETEDNKGNQP